MTRESTLVDMVVHRLMQKSASEYPLYEIIEQSMDVLDYDDSLSIDEIADLVGREVEERFPTYRDRDAWEKHIMQNMLKETEEKMGRLARKVERVKVTKGAEEWGSPDETLQTDWDRILRRVDDEDNRFRAMSHNINHHIFPKIKRKMSVGKQMRLNYLQHRKSRCDYWTLDLTVSVK